MFNGISDRLKEVEEMEFHIKNGDLNSVMVLCERTRSGEDGDISYLIDVEIRCGTPILYAAQLKNWNMVRFFYNAGANLDVSRKPNDWFLLHECAKFADDDLMQFLVDEADVNVTTSEGLTPLMVALKAKNKGTALTIARSDKVKWECEDNHGNTAAHYASLFLPSITQELMDLGADFTVKNKNGDTPFDLIGLSNSKLKAKAGGDVVVKKVKETKVVRDKQEDCDFLTNIKREVPNGLTISNQAKNKP